MKIKTMLLLGLTLSLSRHFSIIHDHLQWQKENDGEEEKEENNVARLSAVPILTPSLYLFIRCVLVWPGLVWSGLTWLSKVFMWNIFNLKIASPSPFIIIPKTFFYGLHNNDGEEKKSRYEQKKMRTIARHVRHWIGWRVDEQASERAHIWVRKHARTHLFSTVFSFSLSLSLGWLLLYCC